MAGLRLGGWELKWQRRHNREAEKQAMVCVLGAVAGVLTVGVSHTLAFAAGAVAATIHHQGGIGAGG